MKRCNWVADDPMYIKYHDMEWGVPLHDDIKLFEMLILEGAQAGLSWLTILKRRETYKIAYDDFDPVKIAKWNSAKIDRLLKDPGIIRNKLKIESAIVNARAYLRVTDEFKSFDEFIWSFVGGRPIQNSWQEIGQIPATAPESDRMSKELNAEVSNLLARQYATPLCKRWEWSMIMLQIASGMHLSKTTDNDVGKA